ncbi:Acetylcholine receptor-like protein cup-4 [Aphelenchoides besseyi]|nr:Acetylcholine receptor-like protein cup-4 [Aphelenchoides besseyi]
MSFWPFSLFDEDASWLTTAVVASAVGFFVFTIRKWKQRPPVVLPPKVSRKRQAIPIEEESGAFKSGLLVDTNKQVMETMWPEINTLYQLFLRGLENEYDLTLHMQAMFIMSWRDTRLIWEPRDFGNITKITFDDYQVKRFWLPKVTAKAIMPMLGSIIQPMNTELLISSEGYVYSISQISTPTLCENQMELYPYDTPHCSLYIVNSNMEDLLIFGNRHMFGLRDSFVNGNNVTQTKGYDILNFTLQRYYITTDGMKPQTTEDLTYTPTKNGEKLESVITMGSVIHYQFFFHRNVDLYVPYILLPIYVGTFLPPNYLRTPFCMKYGIAIFVETIVLLIYKIAYTSLLQNLANEKEVIANLCTINRYFKYFVLIQAIFCTWLLFF